MIYSLISGNNQYSIINNQCSIMERKYDLEDRLIEFSSRIINVVESLPRSRSGNYIASQLIRCGIASALLYGEALGAEWREDFINKMKVIVKELKETRVCLKLIRKRQLIKPEQRLNNIMEENEALVAIISKSIETAKKNKQKVK